MITKIYMKTNNSFNHVNVYTIKAFLDNDTKVLVYNDHDTHYLFDIDDPDIIMTEILYV